MKSLHERRWHILLVQALAVLAIVLSSSAISIALPSIQKEFGATMVELQWTMNAYMLAFASLMLVAGWLGDRIGKKPVFAAGLLLFGLANGLAPFAGSALGLIVLRGLIGAGAAMILPISLALLNDAFEPEERGKAIAAWAGMNSVGIALGPIVGGALVESLGWRSVFFVNLPVAALALGGVLYLVPKAARGKAARFDLLGSLLSSAGLAALFFGLTRSGSEGWGEPLVLGSICAGLALLLLFALVESRLAEPLFDLGLFRSRDFSGTVLALGLMSLSLVGITFALSLYLQFVAGLKPLAAGVRLLPLALGVFVGAGLSNRLAGRIGRRSTIVLGFATTSLVALAFAFLRAGVGYALFGSLLGVLALALGLVSAPATAGLMAALPKDKAAAGSAMNSVVRTAAGAVGIAVLGSVLSGAYRAAFDAGLAEAPALAALPQAALAAARESVGAAAAVAARLPGGATGGPGAAGSLGAALLDLGRESFMRGWNLVAAISAALGAAGALAARLMLTGGAAEGAARAAPERERQRDRESA